MDDLALVQDAMKYETAATATPPTNGTTTSAATNISATSNLEEGKPTSSAESNLESLDLPQDIIDSLSSLSPSDLALLGPLLSGLSLDTEDNGDEGGDPIQLLRRLEQADSAASSLEGQLDELLNRLGGMLGGEEEDLLEEETTGDDGEGEKNAERAKDDGNQGDIEAVGR